VFNIKEDKMLISREKTVFLNRLADYLRKYGPGKSDEEVYEGAETFYEFIKAVSELHRLDMENNTSIPEELINKIKNCPYRPYKIRERTKWTRTDKK
jgi:hypothetical protein